ncbi:MAG: hypothetical protein QJR09_12045 [Micrococcus sp.]|nr:hypothetical protein [Micrococcus sp.]
MNVSRSTMPGSAGATFMYLCPDCGETITGLGDMTSPITEMESYNRWEADVNAHENAHKQEVRLDVEAAALASTPAEVVMPVAIHREARPGRPGNRLICPCGASDWYPQSKHGSFQLLAFLDEHLPHSTVAAESVAEGADCD